jgi:opacity protein-like surface antigen
LRLFLGLRAGLAVLTGKDLAPGLEARPVPAAVGGALNQYFTFALGLDINRHLGVELTAGGWEVVLSRKNVGDIGEYAIYTVIPQLRVRYPIMGGRLVPYAIGGVGLGFAEFNDRKPRGADLDIGGSSYSVAAALGVGIDYFLMSNIAVGIESKYLYSPGLTLTVDGKSEDVTAQTLAVSFGFRVYFASFGG